MSYYVKVLAGRDISDDYSSSGLPLPNCDAYCELDFPGARVGGGEVAKTQLATNSTCHSWASFGFTFQEKPATSTGTDTDNDTGSTSNRSALELTVRVISPKGLVGTTFVLLQTLRDRGNMLDWFPVVLADEHHHSRSDISPALELLCSYDPEAGAEADNKQTSSTGSSVASASSASVPSSAISSSPHAQTQVGAQKDEGSGMESTLRTQVDPHNAQLSQPKPQQAEAEAMQMLSSTQNELINLVNEDRNSLRKREKWKNDPECIELRSNVEATDELLQVCCEQLKLESAQLVDLRSGSDPWKNLLFVSILIWFIFIGREFQQLRQMEAEYFLF